jgi:hypothetical protein
MNTTIYPGGIVDVTDFGATPDDPAFDNTQAFTDAIRSIGSVADGHGPTVFVPRGRFWFADDLHITRNVVLRGGSSIGSAYSELHFSPPHGIVVDSPTTSPDGGRGDFTVVENLSITSTIVPALAATAPYYWSPNHTGFAAGNRVKGPDDTRYYLECMTAGTTGSTRPPGPYQEGQAIVDGSSAWTVGLEPSLRASNRLYQVGEIVRGGKADDNRFYFECTKGGASGASDPFVSPPLGYTPGEVVIDGAVEWTVRVHAGISLLARAFLRNLMISGFTTAGIQIQAGAGGAKQSNANAWHIDHALVAGCGVGVWVAGSDANGGVGIAIDVENPGYQQPGSGGFGIYDHSFLSATWIGCQVGISSGSPYIMDGQASFGSLIGCYAEGGNPPSRAMAPSAVFSGQNVDFTPDSNATRIMSAPTGSRHIFVRDDAGPVELQAWMSLHDGKTVHAFASEDDHGNRIGYERGGSLQPGWWDLRYGMQNARTFYLLSDAAADEGPGHWWDLHGHFRGSWAPGDRYYFGVDRSALTSDAIRNGHFYPGDRFELGSSGDAGDWTGTIVSQEGYRGVPWTQVGIPTPQGRHVRTRYRAWGIPSSQCEPVPPNGFVYRCTRSGYLGAAPPTWPMTVGAEINTWLDSQGGYNSVRIGDLVRPTTPNGHHYRCVAVGSVGGVTGNTEPQWPQAASAQVVDGSGATQVTWQEAGADPVGTYVVDGTAIWTCIGRVPAYSRVGFIDDPDVKIVPQPEIDWRGDGLPRVRERKASLQTTTAAITVLDTSPLADDACTHVDAVVTALQPAGPGAPDGASFSLRGAFLRVGGGAPVVVAAPKVVDSHPNANGVKWKANMRLNGDAVEVRVKAQAGKTVHWSCVSRTHSGT